MSKNKLITGLAIMFLLFSTNIFSQYIMPEETVEHEGTWLQWPHHYTYGIGIVIQLKILG